VIDRNVQDYGIFSGARSMRSLARVLALSWGPYSCCQWYRLYIILILVYSHLDSVSILVGSILTF
jgi:hypothetical protein